MKIKSSLLFLILLSGFLTIVAQEITENDTGIIERDLKGFSGIEAGGIVDLFIEISDEFSVGIATEKNLIDKVITTVDNGVLKISSDKLRGTSKVSVYVKLPELEYLRSGGSTDVTGTSVFNADEMRIYASGATSIKLEVDVAYLESHVSGAADLKISGKADSHVFEVSGAASLIARDMETRKSVFNLSGASDAIVNVDEDLSGTKKGSSSIKNYGDAVITVKGDSQTGSTASYKKSRGYGDSIKVSVGRISVDVYDGDDSVRVRVGNREINIDDKGNVRYHRNKKTKFNGHWAGFELGLNGFVTSDYNMSFPREFEYLDLRMTKSITTRLNFFEQNVALAKNQKWGMVTGMGLTWNDYRFSKPTRLEPDSSVLIGYLDEGISIRKSKLSVFYFNIPLLLEFQTNNKKSKDSFHLGVGMIAGARLSSHTKKYYDEFNKPFNVALYNTEAGNYETVYTATSPDHAKVKRYNDFYLQPFKFDATVRIGWGFINLFGTYSVNQMFKKDKGPELYPWSAGITFVSF